MHSTRANRRGVALIVAIVAIIAIGALIGGAFFASTQEYRIGRNTRVQQRAFSAAEYGLGKTLSQFSANKGSYWNLAVGSGMTTTRLAVSGGDSAIVRVTRIGANTIMIQSEGRAGYVGSGTNNYTALRTTSALIKMAYPNLSVASAMTVKGNLNVQSAAADIGVDTIPPGWSSTECSAYGTQPGSPQSVVLPPGSTVTGKTSGISPAYTTSTQAGADSTYNSFGDIDYASLAANADIQIAANQTIKPAPDPASGTGACNSGSSYPTNWGDINHATGGPCKSYYPTVHVSGDLHLNANSVGQGILLIDGSLDLNGAFDYDGIVIIKDDLKGTGTPTIEGAILAGNNADVAQSSGVSGNASVQYNWCAIQAAARNASVSRPLTQRSWAQLF